MVGSYIGFVYTWSPWIPKIADSLGLMGMPMLWGTKQISQFKSTVTKGYARIALAFNEPNQQGQSDMEPGAAAALWKEHMQPLASQGYTLVSPACTNAPSGKTWMQSFFSQCSGCTVDGLALHFYGLDAQDLITYATDMHDTFELPIYITEYACQDFSGQGKKCDNANNFITTIKNWADETSWLVMHAPFGALYDMGNVDPVNQLLGSDGQPTPLGRVFIN